MHLIMLPPPPPPSFAKAWSSISLRTTVNTQEKSETMVMQSFFFGGGGRCIMGNVKMVSYHPSDHFSLTNRDLFWARQSYLGLQRLHHLP